MSRDDLETDDGTSPDCSRYEQCSDEGADRCWHCGRTRAQHQKTRHGKHATPAIKARPTPEEKARWRALADEEGVPLSEWIIEACRCYELIAKRKGDNLTDADWRRVVSG